MDKFNKSQMLKLFLIAAFLIITPLLSTSLRSKYLYFIVNILILIVGAEAGLLSVFLDSPENKKPAIISDFSADDHKEKTAAQFGNNGIISSPDKVSAVKEQKVQKCPSTPSIFFIGGGEAEDNQLVDDVMSVNGGGDEGEEIGEVSGQELFHKAETFIGNFYKQLKMQREESWKKLHDLYQKAF